MKLKQFLQRKIHVLSPPYRHRNRTSWGSLHLKQLFALFLMHWWYQKRSVITECKSPKNWNTNWIQLLKLIYKYFLTSHILWVLNDYATLLWHTGTNALYKEKQFLKNVHQTCIQKKQVKTIKCSFLMFLLKTVALKD